MSATEAREALTAALANVESRHRRGDWTEDGWVGNSIDGIECRGDGERWPCSAERLRALAALPDDGREGLREALVHLATRRHDFLAACDDCMNVRTQVRAALADKP